MHCNNQNIGRGIKLDPLVQKEIINLYEAGFTQTEVAEHVGVGQTSVQRILVKRGLSRSRNEHQLGKRPSNAIPFNEEFFATPSQPSAYWAGFLMADGGLVERDSGGHVLHLNITDIEHAQLFAEEIGIGASQVRVQAPQKPTHRPMARLSIGYHAWAEQLLPWGIVPRKSYRFITPKVPEAFLVDYLRGWFDGDGCFLERARHERFSLCGNIDGLNWYAAQLRRLGFSTFPNPKLRPNFSYGDLKICGRNNVLAVGRLIEGDPCLQRKWVKLERIRSRSNS